MNACPMEPNEVPVIVMIRPPLNNSNRKTINQLERLSDNDKLMPIKHNVVTRLCLEILQSSYVNNRAARIKII